MRSMPIHERMRARLFLASVRQVIHKGIAAAPACRGRPGQIIIRIKPRRGFASFCRAMQQVMQKRIHARRYHVRIAFAIEIRIEVPPALRHQPVRSLKAPHLAIIAFRPACG